MWQTAIHNTSLFFLYHHHQPQPPRCLLFSLVFSRLPATLAPIVAPELAAAASWTSNIAAMGHVAVVIIFKRDAYICSVDPARPASSPASKADKSKKLRAKKATAAASTPASQPPPSVPMALGPAPPLVYYPTIPSPHHLTTYPPPPPAPGVYPGYHHYYPLPQGYQSMICPMIYHQRLYNSTRRADGVAIDGISGTGRFQNNSSISHITRATWVLRSNPAPHACQATRPRLPLCTNSLFNINSLFKRDKNLSRNHGFWTILRDSSRARDLAAGGGGESKKAARMSITDGDGHAS
ncbi:hypothetical protein R3P38DRAFT_2772227 [Favolaschia claudopus]|uniref:Uncharacterized protein n=1 Tax=Favolaschia claudopus TaxID=2862362 RepID=A0AAW0C4W3_9AGAR